MRKQMLALLLLLALCGCVRHYVITLNNGTQIPTHGKPKLKGNVFVYKDINGQQTSVSAGRVSEVAPASMVKQEKEPFNPGPLR